MSDETKKYMMTLEYNDKDVLVSNTKTIQEAMKFMDIISPSLKTLYRKNSRYYHIYTPIYTHDNRGTI